MKQIAQCICLILCTLSATSVFAKTERKTEFQQAIDKGKIAKIAKLIKKSSPKENADGLLAAAASKSVEAVTAFLEAGIYVNSVNEFGKTPLMSACSKEDNGEIVQLLLENGADANSVDSKGRTPLMFACVFQNYETVQLLLENGTDINCMDSEGRTPLMFACLASYGNGKVKLLLENGADANKVDNKGWSALYYTIDIVMQLEEQPAYSTKSQYDNQLWNVWALIRFGADVNTQCNGETLLFTAQKIKNNIGTYITKALRDAGARLTEAEKFITEQEHMKERRSSGNFYNQVIYRNGIPLEIGDEFTISHDRIQVLDRTTTPTGYTYLVTYYSESYERALDYTYSFLGGGTKYCFMILSKKAMELHNAYSFTNREQYTTSVKDLKLTCIGISQYQHNYQDVDCYMFSLDAEVW